MTSRLFRNILIIGAVLLVAFVVGLNLAINAAFKHPTCSGPLVYPGNWPVAEIRAPPGSERAYLLSYRTSTMIAGAPITHAQGFQGKIWQLGYQSKLPWARNVEFLEKPLRELNYRQVKAVTESDWAKTTKGTPGRVYEYVAPEGNIKVQLFSHGVKNVYELTIFVWDDSPLLADYAEGSVF